MHIDDVHKQGDFSQMHAIRIGEARVPGPGCQDTEGETEFLFNQHTRNVTDDRGLGHTGRLCTSAAASVSTERGRTSGTHNLNPKPNLHQVPLSFQE